MCSLTSKVTIVESSMTFHPAFVMEADDLVANWVILFSILKIFPWHKGQFFIYTGAAKAKDTDENPKGNSCGNKNWMLERKQ